MAYFSDLLASMAGYLWAIMIVSIALIVIGAISRGRAWGLALLWSGVFLLTLSVLTLFSLMLSSS